VKAAIRKLQGENHRGFDLFLRTDAPPGSGLGSSSSLMVTLVGLLKDFKSLPLTDYEIAELAYVIERRDAGIEGGMQDQYAATFGGCNFIEFLGDKVIVNPLRLSRDIVNELEHNLLLCFTGRTHISGRIIEDQTARYQRGEAASLEGLRRQKSLASEMKNLLLQHRLFEFGEALHEAWEYKKKMSPEISNPEIDELYAAARKAGAIGGKLSGAGGGGFMMLYCSFERKHEVAEMLKKMGCAISDFSFDFHGLQTWRVAEAQSR
jgi:D-glycero-alpha-D-manno-heptose-7-phosphate kinase